MDKDDMTLNNLQCLISHKTQPNKRNAVRSTVQSLNLTWSKTMQSVSAHHI